jgi:hypothetical protein
MKALRVRIPAAFNLSDASPIDVCGISVLFVASHDAALTADTLRHVKVKAVLFAICEWALRNPRRSLNGSSAIRCFAGTGMSARRHRKAGALLFHSL